MSHLTTAIATDFASLADLRAFKACKERGFSDRTCFHVGDNGIGCWEDVTAQLQVPMVALPRDVWQEAGKGRHAKVEVLHGGKSVVALLADTMPDTSHIANGAGIDLNPATLRALGLTSPLRAEVQWRWLVLAALVSVLTFTGCAAGHYAGPSVAVSLTYRHTTGTVTLAQSAK